MIDIMMGWLNVSDTRMCPYFLCRGVLHSGRSSRSSRVVDLAVSKRKFLSFLFLFSFWDRCRMLVILIKRKLPSDPGGFLLVT